MTLCPLLYGAGPPAPWCWAVPPAIALLRPPAPAGSWWGPPIGSPPDDSASHAFVPAPDGSLPSWKGRPAGGGQFVWPVTAGARGMLNPGSPGQSLALFVVHVPKEGYGALLPGRPPSGG